MKRYITLPNGKPCGLARYAAAWRALLVANPRALFPGFCYFPESAASIISAMRGGLAERINRHIPGYGRGRKWSNEYFISAWRDSRRLRDMAQRVRVYQFETAEARARFRHLLAE